MRTSGVLLFIAYLGFISLGLPDAAHGINWPFVRTEFGVPTGWLGLLIVGGGVGYFISSFSVGYLLVKLGIGRLITISTLFVSIGLFGFYFSPTFIVFILFAAVIGMGSGGIDVALNSYGAEHFSTKHMNWLHAAFGGGATIGPIIVTFVLVHFSQDWRLSYATLGSIILVMAIVFLFSRNLWGSDKYAPKSEQVQSDSIRLISQRQALSHPVIRFQIIFFFLYSGLEVGVGQWAFTVMTESRGISLASAGTWVAIYWGSLAFGRAIFGFLVERFEVDNLLRLCMVGITTGALFFSVSNTPYTSYVGLALMGFCSAPIYPCMISQTASRVGRSYSTHAIGFQMSAAVMGAMTLPYLSGLIGGQFGLTALSFSFFLYAILLLCLFYIILRKGSAV